MASSPLPPEADGGDSPPVPSSPLLRPATARSSGGFSRRSSGATLLSVVGRRPEARLTLNVGSDVNLESGSPRSPVLSPTPRTGGGRARRSSFFRTSASGEKCCRICLSEASPEATLLSLPCLCKGELGLVHAACAERWFVEDRGVWGRR